MAEKQIIEDFKEALKLVETKYFALDLLVKNFSPEKLAGLARDEGLGAQLGFVSEVFYLGSEGFNVEGREKLLRLYELLEGNYGRWKFLHPNLPCYGKEIVKQSGQNRLNKKWRLYSNLTAFEAKDWLDVYKYWIREHINATL